jgi:hypothetical protein
MSVALRQPTLASAPSPSFCDGRKFSEVEQAVLWTLLQQGPQCTSSDLLDKAAQHRTDSSKLADFPRNPQVVRNAP